MSFFFDLPVLFVIGILLYISGNYFKLKRLSKITIGILIVSCFIIFSVMLYLDVFHFDFTVKWFNNLTNNQFNNVTGYQFMLAWPFFDDKSQMPSLPSLIVMLLFLLYPISIYWGYAAALLISKKRNRNISKELKSYSNVNSRKRIAEIPNFSVVRYPDYRNDVNSLRDAVRMAIGRIDGIDKLVENKSVLIKVNICGGIPDNPGTFTSPEVVEYVVDWLREKTKKPIIVCDADMIWTKFWENAEAIGWLNLDWIERRSPKFDYAKDNAKPQLVNLSETELAYFDFGKDTVFQDNERPNEEMVSTEMLKAEVIISIPKMKTHLLTGVTLGMKNMYGTYPEEDKARYHQRGIDEVIYWVNYAFPPNLTLIDGAIGGEAIGPLSSNDVPYNTIIASNSVPIADAIASKLIGYDHPFEDIMHLKLTKEKELSKPVDKRFLLREIPEVVEEKLEGPATDITSGLPENSKDGNWKRPDSGVASNYEYLMENILAIPGVDTFFNIGADFLLFDLARIPLLKYFNEAVLEFLYEVPRFWTPQKITETNLTRRDWWTNFMVFFFFTCFSIYYFVNNYIFDKKGHPAILHDLGWSQWIILGFSLSIILFALFALILKMKTKNLLGITISAWVVALFVESYATSANWWNYLYENNATSPYNGLPAIPYYPLFSIPIFIVIIISISNFIFKPIFAYVDLNGERFNLVPFVVTIIPLLTLLYLEGYLSKVTLETIPTIFIIYLVLGTISLYYNQKQRIEWNLSIAIVALVLGGTMEYLGFRSGFWSYPTSSHNYFPIFVSLTWVLNTWAACGLAQIFGIDMSNAFPLVKKIDENKNEENVEMVTESAELIFRVNAGIVWKTLNQNVPMTIDDLIEATALEREEIYGALGWLGCENKISVETSGEMRYFSLRP